MLVEIIQPSETWPLRNEVLRPGQPVEHCKFDLDQDPATVHFGAKNEGQIVGIATIYPEPLALIKSEKAFRLRGMAVNPSLHRSGVGRRILSVVERYLRSVGADVLWFNARANAFSFYEALGYEFCSDLFEIPGVGPHKVMFKKF